MVDHAGEPRYLSTSDLARILGFKPDTIRRMQAQGRLNIPRALVGSQWRYDREDVIEYLEREKIFPQK